MSKKTIPFRIERIISIGVSSGYDEGFLTDGDMDDIDAWLDGFKVGEKDTDEFDEHAWLVVERKEASSAS